MRITLEKDFLEIEIESEIDFYKLEKIIKDNFGNIVKINKTLIFIQADINNMYSLLYDITNEFCGEIERIFWLWKKI